MAAEKLLKMETFWEIPPEKSDQGAMNNKKQGAACNRSLLLPDVAQTFSGSRCTLEKRKKRSDPIQKPEPGHH